MKGKEYVRPHSAGWWLAKRSYTLFMLREATALFVGGYAIFLIVLIARAAQEQDAFVSFVEGLKSPVSIVLHLIALAMTAYHSATWMSSIPKATALWRGDERVSPGTLISAGYLSWLLASVLVVLIASVLLRG
jgi:fumarate reductase subunit C